MAGDAAVADRAGRRGGEQIVRYFRVPRLDGVRVVDGGGGAATRGPEQILAGVVARRSGAMAGGACVRVRLRLCGERRVVHDCCGTTVQEACTWAYTPGELASLAERAWSP